MKLSEINWGLIGVMIGSLLFWIALIGFLVFVTVGLVGCKNTILTIPRRNLKPVKIVDQRALWDTDAKAVYVFVDPNTVHIEIGQVRSVSDSNSLEAVADITRNTLYKIVMP